MLEHPDITRMNKYGYLYDDSYSSERVKIGRCTACDEPIYEGDEEEVIYHEDCFFCDKNCLVDAFEEGLIPDSYEECI